MLTATDSCTLLLAERHPATLVVATMTGMLEVFDLEDRPEFLSCVPLMGGAAALGLGLALAQPERPVLVVDGDASLLMQLGVLATIADAAPDNLIHCVIANGVQFEGFANLPTPGGPAVDFAALARAAGYASAERCADVDGLRAAYARARTAGAGPRLLELRTTPAPPQVLDGRFAHFEIPDHQFVRMGREARNMAAVLGTPWPGGDAS